MPLTKVATSAGEGRRSEGDIDALSGLETSRDAELWHEPGANSFPWQPCRGFCERE